MLFPCKTVTPGDHTCHAYSNAGQSCALYIFNNEYVANASFVPTVENLELWLPFNTIMFTILKM